MKHQCGGCDKNNQSAGCSLSGSRTERRGHQLWLGREEKSQRVREREGASKEMLDYVIL